MVTAPACNGAWCSDYGAVTESPSSTRVRGGAVMGWAAVVLAIVTALPMEAGANEDMAAAVLKNIKKESSENPSKGTAVAYGSAGAHPLAVSDDDFNEMYADNKDLWGDMDTKSAHLNYQRSMSGNVDSARLIMEFSMVPSVKSGGSDLHKAAAAGDTKKVAELVDIEKGSALVDPTKGDGTTPLITAAMMGHADVVAILIEQGADVEKVGMNGATALQIAASMGHIDIMTALLDAGANADAPHKFAKSTALHFAAEMGQPEAVQLLCARGANPEAAKIQGGRPLHVAADSNQSEVARVLVTHCKADPNALLLGDTTPLYLAAQKGFIDVVEALLEAAADTEFVMPEGPVGSAIAGQAAGHALPDDASDSEEDKMARYFRGMTQKGSDPTGPGFEAGNGATALHAAVEEGHANVVKMLLKHGVKQSGSMEGATPLILAAMYNQHAIAPLLIEAGAELNARVPKTGNTALYHAVGSGFTRFADVLIDAGVGLEVGNQHGITPLVYACNVGRVEMVHTLLTAGADITAAAEDGTSCLHSAASRGIHGVIAKVLEYRASGGSVDIDQLDNDGQSPLHLAAEAHSAEIIKLLLRAGAELDRRSTSTGATPLMLAARAGRDATAKALLVAGADPNVKGNHRVYQATSLHMAAQGGHLAVVEELIKATARLDARMTLGVSAVGVAAERGHTAVVEALLKAKATVGFKNIHGINELAAAAAGQHIGTVRALAKAGARVSSRDRNGTTALHVAAKAGQSAVAAVLLELGADPTVLTEDGDSPADLARRKRDFEMVKLLGKYEAERAAAGIKGGAPDGKASDSGASEGEDEDEEPPQVVMVSRVREGDDVYLVDKRTGIVYSNDLDSPAQIGTWTADGGVVLSDTVEDDTAERESDSEDARDDL